MATRVWANFNGFGDALKVFAKTLGRNISGGKKLVKDFLVPTFKKDKAHLIHKVTTPKIDGEIRDDVGANEASVAILVLPEEAVSTKLDLLGSASDARDRIRRGGGGPIRGPVVRGKTRGVSTGVKEAMEKATLNGEGENRRGTLLANGFDPIDIRGTRVSRSARVWKCRELNSERERESLGNANAGGDLDGFEGGNSIKKDLASIIGVDNGRLDNKARDGRRGPANNHEKVTRRWGAKNTSGNGVNTTFGSQ